MASFQELHLPSLLTAHLNKLHFHTMTEIQAKSIPAILEGKDLIAQSKTGSGKTLAFGLPCILKVNDATSNPKCLIITPTRELAQQIATELQKLGAYRPNLKIVTLYGGVPLQAQADSLAKGADILIGTPGRIQDHLGKQTLSLKSIQTLVLDEADRMLEMGFYDDMIKIASYLSPKRQTLLFSATFPVTIEKLAASLLRQPQIINIDTSHTKCDIEESLYVVKERYKALICIIQAYKPQSVLVFCNTKAELANLSNRLYQDGHTHICLHGNLDQKERHEALIAFSNGSRPMLVATDVASRGIDIKDIELVINYELPQDEEVYTHRIGRTGRAGATGRAISLIFAKESKNPAYIYQRAKTQELQDLQADTSFTMQSNYETLCLNGGKKTKLRAGDIIGTFCKEMGIDNNLIGTIHIAPTTSYIALHKSVVTQVLKALKKTKIKKKKYIAWILD